MRKSLYGVIVACFAALAMLALPAVAQPDPSSQGQGLTNAYYVTTAAPAPLAFDRTAAATVDVRMPAALIAVSTIEPQAAGGAKKPAKPTKKPGKKKVGALEVAPPRWSA
jgi:hypothetical protein